MITKLTTKNFRAFESLDIDLSRLNIFLGPNNSGKSSILSTFNLFYQTLKSDTTSLNLYGDRFDFGTYSDIVFNNDINKDIQVSFNTKISNNPDALKYNFIFNYLTERKEVIIKEFKLNDSNDKELNNYEYDIKDAPLLNSFGLVEFIRIKTIVYKKDNKKFLNENFKNFRDYFLQSEYIGPLRNPPSRTYLYTGSKPLKVGSKGENLAQFLSIKTDFQRDFKDYIDKWLEKTGIAENLDVSSISDRHFEIRVKNLATDVSQNLADVGFGISQFLPLVAASFNLISNDEDNFLLIEQPELHLHPKAQAEIGTFLSELINQSKSTQVFLETHSEHLITRLQTEIAQGSLKAEDVKVYYVYQKKGEKLCINIPVTEEGILEEDKWPEGFFPEGLEESRKFAKTVRERRKHKQVNG